MFVVSAFVFGRFELTVCFSPSSCLLPGLSSSMLCYLTIFSVDQRAVASGNAFACMCLCFLLMSMAPSFAQLLQVKSNL